MILPSEVAALRRKYEEIVRLREQSLADPRKDPRREMASLAAEFPGALREADELPMEELHHRLRALAASEAGTGGIALWMEVMVRFHALTRGALCAKRWLAGRKDVGDEVRAAFDDAVAGLCYAADASSWREALPELANPPGGRVTELVFERMGTEMGIPAREVRALVFVPRSGDSTEER